MIKVAIVGSGPAGCIAAWACHLAGVDAAVYTNTLTPSPAPGAQYLHSPFVLPWDTAIDPVDITYVKMGTREDYSEKIYGPGFDPSDTSWDRFPSGVVKGWPLHKIYEMIHGIFLPRFVIADVGRAKMWELLEEHDIVFNTSPGHQFTLDLFPEMNTESVWIKTNHDKFDPHASTGLIVYEGSLSVPHYRYSFLEGRESWEYPEDYGDPGCGAILVKKPLYLHSPMMDPRIIPIGRFGKWQKGVLVDSVFGEVSRAIGG